MRRILHISLLVISLGAGGLPVTQTLAKWSRRAEVGHHRRHRRHSRAWWRRHRALLRARRERAERRRQQQQLAAGRAAAANTSLPAGVVPARPSGAAEAGGARAPP